MSTSLSASTPTLNFQPSTSKLRPLSRSEVQRGLPGFHLRQGPGRLLEALLHRVQNLRGDVSGGLAHRHLDRLPVCHGG